jgi:hypothetical protein
MASCFGDAKASTTSWAEQCTNAEPLQHFSFLLTNLSVRFAHRERVVQ